jgi:D-alanyl-D-alanine carboxypeptidase/D-alanyl-D-alanine-endopeptidase (penicillin-binding protein 4)
MTRAIVLAGIAIIFLANCASSARISDDAGRASRLPSRSPYPELKAQIDALLPDSLFPPSNAGIRIMSLTRDEILYDLNPDLLFCSASNQKLVTALAALLHLGPDYELTTRVTIDSTTRSIVVHGSGDPLMSMEEIDSIASFLSRAVRDDSSWTLRGDVSLFDDTPWGKGWMWDDEPDATAMFITPLSVNANSIRVIATPGEAPGMPVIVTTEPPTGFVEVENTALTVGPYEEDSLLITRTKREPSNRIIVKGTLAKGREEDEEISVWNPQEFFLSLLAERLGAKGIRIKEQIVERGITSAFPVWQVSHRLDSVIAFMNKESDNLCAENVFRVLGALTSHEPGGSGNGADAVETILAGLGIDTSRVVTADGSGVSRYNLVTPSILVRILEEMHNRRFTAFTSSLPIAGVDGTLEKRMRGTAAQGNLRGKTGTLEGASNLSGYVRTAEDEIIAFSVLLQNFAGKAKVYRAVQDRIGVYLSTLRRGNFQKAGRSGVDH